LASWLALDWDQDQFHLLCVQSARRGVQVMRAVTWRHPEPFTPSTAERVGRALREFLKGEKIAPAPVLFGIGRDRVHLKELRFPPIASHEEAALVRFQTAKEMTESIDNYAIDYATLEREARGGERQVIAVAARRDMVQMIQTLCQAAGLKLQAVTPRLFGTAAALAQAVRPDASPLTPSRHNVILVLGQRWAELSFYRGERLMQAQALARGPLLLSEIKRNIAVFQAQHAVDMDVSAPECLYVFGDDAEVVQALQAGLNLPVVVLDPLNQEAAAAQTQNPAPFAGALGLALLWSQNKERPINLQAPKKAQAPVSVTRQRGMIYGAAAALVLFFLFGGMYYVLASKRDKLRQLAAANVQYDEDLKSVAQERADIDAYKDWEQTSIPWLEEIYDLTARYPHEIGFRVNQFSAETYGKKQAKDGYVGHITLSGLMPPGKDGSVYQLNAALSRDSHLRPNVKKIRGSATGTAPQEFQLDIDIAKQPLPKYETHLVLPPSIMLEPPPKGPAMDSEDDDGGDQ
jgi:Tfp pilus assembly PilM family ATPase